MIRLTIEEFEREAAAYDAVVRASEGIDRFCSSSDWVLAARAAFTPHAPSLLLRGERGYATFLVHKTFLVALESEWGFACPLVGDVARDAALALERERWDAILLAGLVPGSRALRAVLDAFAPFEIRPGPVLRRWVASLEGGLDGFLARRSAKLRSNVRRAAKRAAALGITFEHEGTLARAVEVERKSWKGAAATGLLTHGMRAFYELLIARLGPRARLLFARKAGEDVGFILGGVRDGTYRGFQFSYDLRLEDVSLGSLLQVEQIRALADEGVHTYDLGIDLPYKRWWADTPLDTVTIAVVR